MKAYQSCKDLRPPVIKEHLAAEMVFNNVESWQQNIAFLSDLDLGMNAFVSLNRISHNFLISLMKILL